MINSQRSTRVSISKEVYLNILLFFVGLVIQAIILSWWFGLERYTFIRGGDVVRVYPIEDGIPSTPSFDWSCAGDVDCTKIAEVIYFEGRSESTLGQAAIGYVVVNRLKSKHFPDTIDKVVESGCSFEYHCKGVYKKGIKNKVAWKKALEVAEGILTGDIKDPTGGASHFVNYRELKRIPKWIKMYKKTRVIGKHTFYRM